MSVFFLLLSVASASTWTVRSDGSGDFSSIPAAVAGASSGDRIEVPAGTWSGPVDFGGKDLQLIGVDGSASTTLTGGGGDAVLSFVGGESSEARIEGFTLSDGVRAVVVNGGSPTLVDLVVTGFGDEAAYGGAVWVGDGRPTFERVWFSDNLGLYGGAVMVSGGVPSFVDCTFEGNGLSDYSTAMSWGGGIYTTGTDVIIQDSVFDGNMAHYGSHVGMWSGGKLSITGGSLIGGIATYGSVAVQYSSWTALDGVSFEGNAAYYQGGAVWVSDTDRLSATECVFSENSVYSSGGGGAIAAYDPGELLINSSSFIDNVATYTYGAGIWTYYPALVDIIDSEFTGQRAYYAGGAVHAYVMYGPTRVLRSSFSDNSTTYGTGGALHLDYGTHPVTVEGVEFDRNVAGTHGGGIYVNDLAVDIVDSTFTRNTAGWSGGGARVDNTRATRQSASIMRVTADSNTATGDGGALSVANVPALELVDISASHNISGGAGGGLHTVDVGLLEALRLRMVDNQGDYGGGLYIADVGAAPPDGELAELLLRNVVLQQNSARYGGGVCVLQSVDAVVRQATIVGNAATEQGSGICAYSQVINLQNTVLAWNTGGGAVEALDEVSATGFVGLYNAWHGNSADVAGGILDTPGSTDVSADPRFANSLLDASYLDAWTLAAGSPLIDAGNPSELDPNGSVSDIGAMGGADTWQEDLDGDGHVAWLDCDDLDVAVYPGATDSWYDGVDSNCDGASDFDADADGVSVDDDCDDSDPTLAEDCSEPEEEDTSVDPDPVEDTGESVTDNTSSSGGSSGGDKGGCATVGGGSTSGLSAMAAWFVACVGLARRRSQA